ncbi:SH3 domain-containing protein [Aquimarina rubra]|uniref:SH3 domain-containing protein n=1 Tax=Aquimarina rubra TaxID=1920033 RepID=A0ABW5LL13_9FLAO
MINLKRLTLLIGLLAIQISVAQGYDEQYKFSVGDEVYLFGDNVKLREAPNTDSKTIGLLSIGTKVTVLKVEDDQYEYKGVSGPWYQVSYANQEGYVVGGLLSLTKHNGSISGDNYFVYGLEKDAEGSVYVMIRSVKNKAVNSEKKFRLFGNGSFGIIHSTNKGIDQIQDIIIIDNYSEACGIDGGKSYVVYDGNQLIHMANTSEIGDGGIYHYQSEFIFPSDPGGVPDMIIYKQENGEMKDEETDWYVTTSQQRNLTWDGEKLQPEDYKN